MDNGRDEMKFRGLPSCFNDVKGMVLVFENIKILFLPYFFQCRRTTETF